MFFLYPDMLVKRRGLEGLTDKFKSIELNFFHMRENLFPREA